MKANKYKCKICKLHYNDEHCASHNITMLLLTFFRKTPFYCDYSKGYDILNTIKANAPIHKIYPNYGLDFRKAMSKNDAKLRRLLKEKGRTALICLGALRSCELPDPPQSQTCHRICRIRNSQCPALHAIPLYAPQARPGYRIDRRICCICSSASVILRSCSINKLETIVRSGPAVSALTK